MYFDGTTLTTLLSDTEKAAANAPVIAAAGPRYTSALAVIEAAMELPELGEAGVTNFLDVQGIELRDMPPRSSFDRRGAGDGRQAERSPACRLRGLFRDRGVRASDR